MYQILSKLLIAGFLDGVRIGKKFKQDKRAKRFYRFRDNRKFSDRGTSTGIGYHNSVQEQDICMEQD